MFDPIPYLRTLHTKMKLIKEKYAFCRISGINELEEVISKQKRFKFFFAIDDSEDGVTVRGQGGGYFEKRVYSVFILGKADYGNMDQREEVLNEARKVYRIILSKLIKDKAIIQGMSVDNIRFFEVPQAFAFGTAGLYFIFSVENPVNLMYDAAEWDG